MTGFRIQGSKRTWFRPISPVSRPSVPQHTPVPVLSVLSSLFTYGTTTLPLLDKEEWSLVLSGIYPIRMSTTRLIKLIERSSHSTLFSRLNVKNFTVNLPLVLSVSSNG